MFNDTLEKAQAQPEDARSKEKSNLQKNEMRKQSLDDEIALGNTGMDRSQSCSAPHVPHARSSICPRSHACSVSLGSSP